MAFGLDPGSPLLVAANRDERMDRPATAMTVLRERGPRILGGRDEAAGGTWLAVNEHGLVAGLTNRPLPAGRDPAKHSRGELPLALASHRTADGAVREFVDRFRPDDYNPAWLLLADRRSIFAVDMTGGPRPRAWRLGPGLHVLENNPLSPTSAKAAHVRSLLGDPAGRSGDDLMESLRALLGDHSVADAGPADAGGRRPETMAACVHTEDYGTRSADLIRVRASEALAPEILYADGHPCTTAFLDAGGLWDG